MKVVNALRNLVNTTRGAPPRLLRQEILACVLPLALFGEERWWPGIKKKSIECRIALNRFMRHLDTLRKVILFGARTILPIYRTTPRPSLLRELGLLQPVLELDKRSRVSSLPYSSFRSSTSSSPPGRVNKGK